MNFNFLLKNRKLKNLLIYPRFQLTLVVVNLVIMSLSFALVFFQVIDSFDFLNQIGEKLHLSTDSAFFKLLTHQKDILLNKLYIAAAVSYTFSFIMTIYFSHKATGPIYRLKTYFIEMKEDGTDYPLSFRKGDYYSDLPEIINDGIEQIKK
jgi:hypothetical protein